jgi:hypothetical protein
MSPHAGNGHLPRRSPRPSTSAGSAGSIGSIGSIGDALDSLMQSTIGLLKTELIDRQRSWTGRNEVERETAAWVHRFNTERLHSAGGYRPPVEFENIYRDTHRHRGPRRGRNRVSVRSRTVQSFCVMAGTALAFRGWFSVECFW